MGLNDPAPLITAASTLPDPPVSWAYAYDKWRSGVGELDLELWGASSITALKICGAVPKALGALTDDIDSVNAGTDVITSATHGFRTGDGPFRVTTTGSLTGTGLALATDYWIGVLDANTYKLFLSREALLSAGSVAAATAVDILGAGSGTHTLTATAGAERLHWLNYGLLGPVFDGAVVTTAAMGYSTRFRHRPRAVAYALIGTIGSGTPSATLYYAVPATA